MMINKAAGLFAALAALSCFTGCGDDAASAKRPAGPVAAATVSVEPAQQRSVPVRLQAIGNVEAYATVSLKARVDGQIVAVNFTEGKEVRKGEILFRIDPRSFEAALRQAMKPSVGFPSPVGRPVFMMTSRAKRSAFSAATGRPSSPPQS